MKDRQVLFRVTKTRYHRKYDYLNGVALSDWSMDKQTVDYRSRESDVKQAINYANQYSHGGVKYEVEVEVAFMPRFHDYDKMKSDTQMGMMINILKDRQ